MFRHESAEGRIMAACTAVLVLTLCAPLGHTQQATCIVPANVWNPDGGTRGLSADAFVVHDRKRPIQVLSCAADWSPRRVIFVADNGHNVSPAARQIEVAVITDMLAKARPEDSFALLTARGPRVALRVGSSRDVVRAAAEQLENAPQGKSGCESVLDAVLEATDWFQPTRPGDSILLLALNLEGRHRASFSKARAALTAGRIRLFGFELGEVNQPDLLEEFSNLDSFFSIPRSGFGNVDHFLALSVESGGVAVRQDTTAEGKGHTVPDVWLGQLRYTAELLYEAIAEYDLLHLSSVGPHTAIDLAPSVRRQLPVARVLYPRNLPQCPAVP
jgi:hypothetical protein